MQEKLIKSFDNSIIYYEYQKFNNSNPTLIFIHGLSGNHTTWNNVVSYFHKIRYSTIALDIYGHGKSLNTKKKERFTLINFAKDINAIISQEKIKKYILIGNCLGGMISLVYDSLFPKKASGFILIAATPANFIKYQYSLTRFLPTSFYNLTTKIIGKITQRINRKNKPYIDFSKLSKHNALTIIYYDLKTTSFTAYVYSVLSMIDFDVKKNIEKIIAPTLIIIGENDKVMHRKSALEIHEKIKSSQLSIMKKTDHLIPIRKPKELAEIIRKWISENYG